MVSALNECNRDSTWCVHQGEVVSLLNCACGWQCPPRRAGGLLFGGWKAERGADGKFFYAQPGDVEFVDLHAPQA
jgi:hypothetical protein